ncbi:MULTISPECIES: NAD(P)/FAD-dependent oxidoreductase [Burkholderia]|uniref:NAD(P)/FAD-dependent oxidoreductase n=1 Tax=Burkholderia TaxID=32008 RepID=UPI0006791CA8|nr:MULTISPECIES: NAD(P)/FAD-dependent oxidoreductase [Burkholderia]KWU28616.1 FAD-dependent oxidoreductase [Burkholderia cenocepacia]MBP0716262.1 NAD(P)/FAD-dependent oxidoreductase [Burkholderia sp. AcTa6-5]OXI76886.1 NAD(P)/FAD-dependent oxidoreductase [Burkholderia sp. AU31280]QRR15044.1 NAD(P)-binding protein [Burkholderia sp. MS389]QVN10177.1 NAD(P)/FAD-dependent oxidoreductase [Burkholderia sp. LAS2]
MSEMKSNSIDVAIIGAGPSGAVAAALLRKAGRSVLVLERQHFPRFSIGESLLPQSMQYLEEAGMLQAVVEAGFQFKNGAYFVYRDRMSSFDFREKFSAGWGTAYQVERAAFDDLLIRCAAEQGADVRFGHTVRAFQPGDKPRLDIVDEAGHDYSVQPSFVLDASGFGRVLPRLLDLDAPTGLPTRAALFSHVEDSLPAGSTDRDKICIAVHPERRDVWFWMIPLTNGRSSVGCVADAGFLDVPDARQESLLRELLQSEPTLSRLVGSKPFVMPVRRISGYASNVETLHGPGYALLGNAGEFLDPIFSSGVTIAMRSAQLAVAALERQLRGESVDWARDYDIALRKGIDTFRAFVERWYSGALQDIVFHEDKASDVKRMVCSILAGYAWDQTNPFVREPARGLDILAQLCSSIGGTDIAS